MSSFKLGEVGEYIPQNVAENTFLNDRLESDMYGIYYSVKFEGDAETYLMQAKKAPVEGQAEWGMIEQSKSGKSMRFKRVKREDTNQSHLSSGNDTQYLKDTSDLPRSLIIELLKYYDVQSLYNSPQYTKMIALAQSLNDDIMLMIKANRSDKVTSGSGDTPINEPASTQAKAAKN